MSAHGYAPRGDVVLLPSGEVVHNAPSRDPAFVLGYLRGLDAGDRHGYARGRADGLRDLWRAALTRLHLPAWVGAR